jgi:hypothetical protein
VSTQASTVGSLSLPLDAGTADTAFDDPLLAGLLDYFAHWLNYDLNPRLANLSGRTDEAVPAANRYAYDPGRTFNRKSIPALYMWREKATRHAWSTVVDELRSTVRCFYIFEELDKPEGLRDMNGLFGVVASTLSRATRIERHATWAYGAFPANTDITRVLGIDGWDLLGDIDFIEAIPEPGSKPVTAQRNATGDGAQQHFFPIISATWTVREFIEPSQATELVAGATVTRQHDGLTLDERNLPPTAPSLPDPS